MVNALGESASMLLTSVRRPVKRADHERCRAELLDRLLRDLSQVGPVDLLIESRQAHNDQRDRHAIAAAQNCGLARDDISYTHGDPRTEPLRRQPMPHDNSST